MFKNIASNWLLLVVTLGVTCVLLPFNVHALGQERYGVWLLIASMTGYLSLVGIGVPMASVHFIARHVARNEHDEANTVIANCAGLYLALGLTSLLIGAMLFLAFNAFYAIPFSIRASARAAFLLVLISTAISFLGFLPHGILQAHQAFVARNMIVITVLLVRFGLTLLLVTLRPAVDTIAVIQLAATLLEMLAASLVVHHYYPYVTLKLARCCWSTVRRISSFSVSVLILGIGIQLMFLTDSLVIGRIVHINEIPIYAVANNITVYLMEFVVGIAGIILPMATQLHAQGDLLNLRAMFLKWSKIVLSLTLCAGLYVYVFGPGFIALWVGPSFEAPAGEVLRILVLSFFVFLPVRAVCVPVLAGLGKPGRPAIAMLLAGVLNLILSVILARVWGLAGVAWGTAIPSILFAAYVLLFTCQELGISLSEYTQYVLARAAIGALPIIVFLFEYRRLISVPGYLGLGIACCIMTAVFGFVWIVFVYRNDDYTDLHGIVSMFLRRYVNGGVVRVWSYAHGFGRRSSRCLNGLDE